MSWSEIKAEILGRHEHAFEHGAGELRVVLAFDGGSARVPLVVRRHGELAYVVAHVANGTAQQVTAMLRAATALGVPLVMIEDAVCVRAPIANDNVERTLQTTARAALRVRRMTTTTPERAELGAFAFAL